MSKFAEGKIMAILAEDATGLPVADDLPPVIGPLGF